MHTGTGIKRGAVRGRTGWLVGTLALPVLLFHGIGAATPSVPGGALHILDDAGQPHAVCPLTHTAVEADISGFVSRVQVRQAFRNPLSSKIEAVYVFPLPQDAAVDHMVMQVGERRIVGQVKPRDVARELYETARAAGQAASLLDQERPNIFTQSVANIEPGTEVVIEISYVATLQVEDSAFTFTFPMVVGPRYMPGSPNGKQGPGWSPDTSEVPDASHISPPVTPPGQRAGHDISLIVRLDAGMDIVDLQSPLHAIRLDTPAPGRAIVQLVNQTTIPNKDFILRYRTATKTIGDAFLTHQDARGTFFTLVLQPPQRVRPAQAVAKEMIFVIDRSGSMNGFPIEKAKETMRLAIAGMNPHDTFNLLSFAGGTGRCFPQPVANTPRHRAMALKYLADLHGSGGTEMMPAILEALGGTHDPERVRIVAFMTDGYIGNDVAIIDAVRMHAGTARVFAFGIGNAVNRFLLDGMAQAGRGEAEYVTLQSQGEEAAQRFHARIQSPVLTDIAIDWGNLAVSEVYPRSFPDLFSNKPIMIHGRLTGPAQGTITLRGQTADGYLARRIDVRSTAPEGRHQALPSLWARAKIQDLMMQDYAALHSGQTPEAMQRTITALGVDYGLMTRFTSFIAIEEMTVTVGGKLITLAVPVEMPEGVSYDGVFGQKMASSGGRLRSSGAAMSQAATVHRLAAPVVPMMRSEASTDDASHREDEARNPLHKLASPLATLPAQVQQAGVNGSLTIGQLRVVDYRVDVMVFLNDLSEATLAALKEVGFVQSGESKTIHLVIGSIDVRQLEALAGLESVRRITPAVG